MGYDARCTLRVDGEASLGTASLEGAVLSFRGPFRLAVPLAEVTGARAEGGALIIHACGRVLEFEIGDAAVRWVRRITNPPSRVDKLGVKKGMRIAVLNLRDVAFRQEIERAGARVLARPSAGMDAVFLGASTPADLNRLGALVAGIQPAGAVWVVRRKGQTAVTERASMEAGRNAGLVDVKVVSFSDTHTAEKYVIPRSARRVSRERTREAPPLAASAAPRTRGRAPSRGRT
jgi:hypothetical protein